MALNHFSHLDPEDFDLAAVELDRAAHKSGRGSDTRHILLQVAEACAATAEDIRRARRLEAAR